MTISEKQALLAQSAVIELAGGEFMYVCFVFLGGVVQFGCKMSFDSVRTYVGICHSLCGTD